MAIQTIPLERGAPVRATAGTAKRREESRAGWGLAAPFLIFYLLFVIGPIVYGIIMSFFNSSLQHAGLGGFAGASNYVSALTSADFWAAMWHTVLFTLMTTPPLVAIALVLAMFTDRLRRGRWFFRLLFFAPYVVPSSAVALIWGFLYTPELGLWQHWLSAVGITAPNWLNDPSWAMASIALMTVWWTLGFNFVLYLAGLQDIPRELYEAASVDGASPWRQLRSITIPMLRQTTLLVLVLQIIASLKIFDQIFLTTQGGPNYVTRPLLEYVYDIGFTDFRTGYAAAASMLYMLVIVAVSVVWFVLNRRQQAAAGKGA
jgi:multiple sugar transport system permease protein